MPTPVQNTPPVETQVWGNLRATLPRDSPTPLGGRGSPGLYVGIRTRAGEAAEALNGEAKVRKNAQKSILSLFKEGKFHDIHPKSIKNIKIHQKIPQFSTNPY